MRLADAVVVITGAGNGIGAAMSRKFAESGAEVVLGDVDVEGVERVAAEVGGLAVPGDAASEDGVRVLVDAALAEHGRIDLQVADVVADSLDSGEFLILPHPEVADYYALRAGEPRRWHAGMRKLQRKVQ